MRQVRTPDEPKSLMPITVSPVGCFRDVRCQPAFVFTSPVENPRASGHGAMTFVPFGIPHGVLSGLLLPLRMLGAVKRDVFLDYPHVAVEVAPAAQLKLFRSGNEFQNV